MIQGVSESPHGIVDVPAEIFEAIQQEVEAGTGQYAAYDLIRSLIRRGNVDAAVWIERHRMAYFQGLLFGFRVAQDAERLPGVDRPAESLL